MNDKMKNKVASIIKVKGENEIKSTVTELHTHLMGMLSAKKFLLIVRSLTTKVYWPLDKGVDFSSQYINVDDLINSEEYLDLLRIEQGKTVEYSNLDKLYQTRTQLLKYLVNLYQRQCEEKDKTLIESKIYSIYVNECLKELINQGVEYVEISYSIPRIIQNIVISEENNRLITTKFLLSTDRSRSLKDFKESSKKIGALIESGKVKGFDVMGQEIELSDSEKDYLDKSKKSQSFKRKIEVLVKELNNYQESVLRIHSGETPVSFSNTEQILTYLEEIEKEQNIFIPPPEVRIGHGVYFEKNENYLRLLKKFNIIVEINASSNIALRNIETYNLLPYNYYLDNGIKISLSTDGHGLYDTTIPREFKIAQLISSSEEKIKLIDEEIVRRNR